MRIANPEFSMCDVCGQVAIKTPVAEVSAMFGTRNVVKWAAPAGWTGEVCPTADPLHDAAKKALP